MTCPECDTALAVAQHSAKLATCLVCGNADVFKKKDFPHWLGLTILAAAAWLFLTAHWFYWPRLAWAALIGSALVDGILYLCVGDAVVCYACGAVHRRFVPDATVPPFELVVAERYRQERLRRARIQEGQRKPH